MKLLFAYITFNNSATKLIFITVTFRTSPLSVESVQQKTTLLLKKFSLTDQLHPAGSRPTRLYGLPKIHTEGIPLRPIVSNIGTPTYQLSKSLAGLLNQLHQKFGIQCEKFFPVRTDTRISTNTTR